MSERSRIESIDMMRGWVMLIMALDHVRDYFHADFFLYSPTDLTQTSFSVFFTRFITHYCAPVFVFLAGTSAYFVSLRRKKKELSIWLLKRGLWLILLEITVINFGWNFIWTGDFYLQVIWAIGISMIFLAFMVHLPRMLGIVVGLVLIFGHNAFDHFHITGNGFWSYLWVILHEEGALTIQENWSVVVAYPLIPWIGVMLLGYYFGRLYSDGFSAGKRKKWLLSLGIVSILLFLLLRVFNFYGDPNPWSMQVRPWFEILSFLNVQKYPPSLLFLLITLGPTFILLSIMEGIKNPFSNKLVTIGRVPMFYYIVHIYFIHILAMLAAMAQGFSYKIMLFGKEFIPLESIEGYGFSLFVTYVIWIFVVLCLYPMSNWFDKYKRRNRHKWWLSYL